MKRISIPHFLRLVIGFMSAVPVLDAQSTIELPNGEVGVAYSASVSPENPPEGLVYSASNLPEGLEINASNGLISGTPETAGDYTPTLTFTADGESDNVPATITIAPAAGTPVINSSSTASGVVGQAFSYTLTATNSPTSYTVNGLPDGLEQAVQGGAVISGTPTASGTFQVAAFATNAMGDGAAFDLEITIDPAGPVPEITSSTNLEGDANALLTYQIVATNDPASYSASGLPLDVSINTSTGLISGTPTIEGTYEVVLNATNAFGTSSDTTLIITIGDVPRINNVLTLELTFGKSMGSFELSASNNPTSFSLNESQLPTGLSYSNGVLSGIPTELGTFMVTIFASNAIDDGPEETLVITVSAPIVLDENLTAGVYSVDFSNGSAFAFEFTRSFPVAGNLSFFIETSESLLEWTSTALDDSSLSVEYVDNGDGTETVTVTYPSDIIAGSPGFIRYKVQAAAE